jgi:hypothetical protein
LQAVIAAAFAYAVMSYLMTATPISMYVMEKISLDKKYHHILKMNGLQLVPKAQGPYTKRLRKKSCNVTNEGEEFTAHL